MRANTTIRRTDARALGESFPDVMQVCRNGHVITDLLLTFPERGLPLCDRCGAPTLDHCPTCGQPLPGARFVPGLVPMGTLPPPERCSVCGGTFPWAKPNTPCSPADRASVLEQLLRRVPRAVRQLRTRQDNRPAFRVKDEHDLEDLLRALLPLHFDTVRPENRTPAYAPGTRMDFRLGDGEGTPDMALTIKIVNRPGDEARLAEQWPLDLAHYQKVQGCRLLVGLVYDREAVLHDPRRLEQAWSQVKGDLELRCLIIS